MTSRPSEIRRSAGRPDREPVIGNLAPVIAGLCGLIAVLHLLQIVFPALTGALALSPWLVWQGEKGPVPAVVTFLTYGFVHGDWLHAGFNIVFLILFGAPVAQRLTGRGNGKGQKLTGAIIFLSFFLTAILVSGLFYGVLYAGERVQLIGASGGVSALMAAWARIVLRRFQPASPAQGRLLSPFNWRIVFFTAIFVILNVLTVTPAGILVSFGTSPDHVAWELHIAGFLFGLFAISFYDWLAPKALR